VGVARWRGGGWRFAVSAVAGGTALSVDAVYALRDVEKTYTAGGTEFRLRVSQLEIARGARIALIGESGSGKSTLLELLAMILQPSGSGGFEFTPQADGQAYDIAGLWHARATDTLGQLRSRHIGYVLQYGGLLPYLSVRGNIELPCELLGLPLDGVASGLADKLGIGQQLDKRPSELSVGQRQRAAIARALAHAPPIVIADEPTAAIDPPNAERIVALLAELAGELGVTLIMATHAQELVRRTGFTLIRHQVSSTSDRAMTVDVSDG